MRKLLFYNFRPLILASKTNKIIMFFSNPFFLLICWFGVGFETPSKSSWRQNGTKSRPSGAKMAPSPCRALANTCRNVVWVEPSFLFDFFPFFHFPILAAQLAKNTWLFLLGEGSAKYIEKHNANELSEIQWPPKGKQKQNKRLHPVSVSRCIWLLRLWRHNC